MLTKGPIPEGPLALQKPNFHVIYTGELESAPPLCYFLQPIMFPKPALRCSSQWAAAGKMSRRSRKGRELKLLIPNCLDTSLSRAFETCPDKALQNTQPGKVLSLQGEG